MKNPGTASALSELMNKYEAVYKGMAHLFPEATHTELVDKTDAAMSLAISQIEVIH